MTGTRAAAAAALAAALALSAHVPPASGFAGDGDTAPTDRARGGADDIPASHAQAIEDGLRFLATRQPTPGPGYFSPGPTAVGRTAVTALATLAFLGAGHGLQRGRYHEVVERAVVWLLDAQKQGLAAGTGNDGYISTEADDLSRMHGHGFATLALAEAYGTAGGTTREGGGPNSWRHAKRLHDAVDRAVKLIERSQSITGGWGYLPADGNTPDHEGSITVCQVQALQAASNRGFPVSLSRIQSAREYMRKSQDEETGGVKYRLTMEGFRSATYALTAAGVTSLFGLGEQDRKAAITAGMRYLDRHGPPDPRGTPYFYYAAFYATQAYHRFDNGSKWEGFWVPFRRNRLLRHQGADGSWSGKDGLQDLGPVYPTAMCLLMLEVPVGYLSIYAR